MTNKSLLILAIISLTTFAEDSTQGELHDDDESIVEVEAFPKQEIAPALHHHHPRPQTPRDGDLCVTIGGKTHCRPHDAKPFVPQTSRLEYFCKDLSGDTFWSCFHAHVGRTW